MTISSQASSPVKNLHPIPLHPDPRPLVVRVGDEQWAAMLPPDHAEWLERDGAAEAESSRKWFENLPGLRLPTEN